MANVRSFKKDIDFVVNELVIECFTYDLLFPDKNTDKIAALIAEVIKMGEDILKKVNGVKATKEQTAKVQFTAIRKEFFDKVEGFVQTLEKLNKE